MVYYLCRIINVTASIVYPTFASYKALKSTTTSTTANSSSSSSFEQQKILELERWTRYWCIFGIIWLYQDWFEWSLNWLPFYFEFKTLLILWIVLPQLQGSKYLYEVYFSPLIETHSETIDQFIVKLTREFKSFGLDFLNRLIKSVLLSRGGRGRGGGTSEVEEGVFQNLIQRWITTTTSSVDDDDDGDDSVLTTMVVASNTLLDKTLNKTRQSSSSSSSSSKLRKKQRLERELAALNSSTSSSSDQDDEDDDEEEEEGEEVEDYSRLLSASSDQRKTRLRK